MQELDTLKELNQEYTELQNWALKKHMMDSSGLNSTKQKWRGRLIDRQRASQI